MKLHTMSAGALHVLLWHYFSPESYPAPAGNHEQVVSELQRMGLLTLDDASIYRASEMGVAYVEMLLCTPLPVLKWSDPRPSSRVRT